MKEGVAPIVSFQKSTQPRVMVEFDLTRTTHTPYAKVGDIVMAENTQEPLASSSSQEQSAPQIVKLRRLTSITRGPRTQQAEAQKPIVAEVPAPIQTGEEKEEIQNEKLKKYALEFKLRTQQKPLSAWSVEELEKEYLNLHSLTNELRAKKSSGRDIVEDARGLFSLLEDALALHNVDQHELFLKAIRQVKIDTAGNDHREIGDDAKAIVDTHRELAVEYGKEAVGFFSGGATTIDSKAPEIEVPEGVDDYQRILLGHYEIRTKIYKTLDDLEAPDRKDSDEERLRKHDAMLSFIEKAVPGRIEGVIYALELNKTKDIDPTYLDLFRTHYEGEIEKLRQQFLTSQDYTGTKGEIKNIINGAYQKLQDTVYKRREEDNEKEQQERLQAQELAKMKEEDRKKYEDQRKKEGYLYIHSFEDMAEAIMTMDPLKWGSLEYNIDHGKKNTKGNYVEGQFALLRARKDEKTGEVLKDEDGEIIYDIQYDNFVRWIISRIEFFHGFDPDSPISFFGQIQVENDRLIRPAALGTIIGTGKYFESRRKDANPEEISEVNAKLQQLRDVVIHMGWLVGGNRNMDVEWRNTMGNDTKLPETIIKLLHGDMFAKEDDGRNTLEILLTWAQQFGKEGDVRVGSAFRSNYLMYYNISDYDKLKTTFKHGTFNLFEKSTMDEAIEDAFQLSLSKTEKKLLNTLEKAKGEDARKAREAELKRQFLISAKILKFDKDGKIKSSYADWYKDNKINDEDWYLGSDKKVDKGTKGSRRKHVDDFTKFMNIFDPPTRNRRQIAIARALIKRVAAERAELYLLDEKGDILLYDEDGNVTQDKNIGKLKLDEYNVNFAELNALWATYWSDAASHNDITVTAANAKTKTEAFYLYLMKQAHPDRGGAVGNIREVGLQRRLTVGIMEGMLTENGEAPMEILEEMERVEYLNVNATPEQRAEAVKAVAARLKFAQNEMRQKAVNHDSRGFDTFHAQISGEEPKFSQFAHYDTFGRVTYDAAGMASEVQEKIIKPTRYRLSTHRLKYSFVRRDLVNNENGNPTFETRTEAESMFNPQVLLIAQKIYLRSHKNEKPFLDEKGAVKRNKNYKKGEDERLMFDEQALRQLTDRDFARSVTKAILITKFSAMLASHSTHNSDLPFLNFATRELIIRTLGKIAAGVVDDEQDLTKTRISQYYFTKEDIDLLREASGNHFMRGAIKSIGAEGLGGFARGMGDALGEILKGIFS